MAGKLLSTGRASWPREGGPHPPTQTPDPNLDPSQTKAGLPLARLTFERTGGIAGTGFLHSSHSDLARSKSRHAQSHRCRGPPALANQGGFIHSLNKLCSESFITVFLHWLHHRRKDGDPPSQTAGQWRWPGWLRSLDNRIHALTAFLHSLHRRRKDGPALAQSNLRPCHGTVVSGRQWCGENSGKPASAMVAPVTHRWHGNRHSWPARETRTRRAPDTRPGGNSNPRLESLTVSSPRLSATPTAKPSTRTLGT